jgi:hypothetical protein
MSQIPRVVDPDADVFHQYFVSQGAPVVLVGSRVFHGAPKTLEEILAGGGAAIEVSVRGGDYLHPSKRVRERMTLGEYVDTIIRPRAAATEADGGTASLPPYSGNTPLSKSAFAALGFRYPEPFRGKSFEFPRLWIGPQGSMTPLHYDSRDNLICQYCTRAVSRRRGAACPIRDTPTSTPFRSSRAPEAWRSRWWRVSCSTCRRDGRTSWSIRTRR